MNDSDCTSSAADFDPLAYRWNVPRWAWLTWAGLFALALLLDTQLRVWITPETAQWVDNASDFWFLAKQPGEWWMTALVALLIWRLHPWGWRGATLPIVSVLVTALLVMILKWTLGRQRPEEGLAIWHVDLFRAGLGGFFEQRNLTFPSGHATKAFALATSLAILAPRGAPIYFAIAFLCAAERVGELAHWFSDVTFGAMLGIITTRIVMLGLLHVGGFRNPAPVISPASTNAIESDAGRV